VGRGGAQPSTRPEPAAVDAAPPRPPAEVRLPTGAPSATVEVRSELSAPVDQVWAVLDDFHRLAACLPGAELVEVLADDRYRGRATVALGPVKLAFDGLAQVVERMPDEHRMRVLAQGADAGGSSTQADIRLAAEPAAGGGTVLRADAALFLSGRIAQFGRALAGDVSRRLFEQFGAAVEENALTGRAPAVPAKPPSALALLAATVAARLRNALARRRR
jgi:carbon monoxide dehydrogenase subunit G